MTEDSRVPDWWEPSVYIITGMPGEGKTTFLMETLACLKDEGVRICGIAAPGYFRDGTRSGFSIIDLSSGESEELCSVDLSPDSRLHGRYYFRCSGLSFGSKALVPPVPWSADLLVVDEVGRFELMGAVWGACIDRIVCSNHPPMIWTVRRSLVNDVISKWHISRPVVVDICSAEPSAVVSGLLDEIGIYRMVADDLRAWIGSVSPAMNKYMIRDISAALLKKDD